MPKCFSNSCRAWSVTCGWQRNSSTSMRCSSKFALRNALRTTDMQARALLAISHSSCAGFENRSCSVAIVQSPGKSPVIPDNVGA